MKFKSNAAGPRVINVKTDGGHEGLLVNPGTEHDVELSDPRDRVFWGMVQRRELLTEEMQKPSEPPPEFLPPVPVDGFPEMPHMMREGFQAHAERAQRLRDNPPAVPPIPTGPATAAAMPDQTAASDKVAADQRATGRRAAAEKAEADRKAAEQADREKAEADHRANEANANAQPEAAQTGEQPQQG